MSEHSFYTDMAIRCLDEHDREVWRHVSDAIIDDYCTWPDQYFDPSQYRRIAPYQLVIDELPFHYPPPNPPYRYFPTELNQLREELSRCLKLFAQSVSNGEKSIRDAVPEQKTETFNYLVNLFIEFFQFWFYHHFTVGCIGVYPVIILMIIFRRIKNVQI